jgi:hypothetical protein
MKNLFFAFTAVAAISMAAPAAAQLQTNANLANGVYYGAGNVNGNFVTNTQGGIELGLRSKIFQGSPMASVGNVYTIPLGNVFSFDFSIDPSVGPELNPVTGFTSLLSVQNLKTGETFNINPYLYPDNALGGLTAPGGIQNSQRINFNYLGLDYDANEDNSFLITLTATNVPGLGQGFSATNLVNVGAGFAAAVPEPASWAMMISGFGLVGGAMRSRKTSVSTPALA